MNSINIIRYAWNRTNGELRIINKHERSSGNETAVSISFASLRSEFDFSSEVITPDTIGDVEHIQIRDSKKRKGDETVINLDLFPNLRTFNYNLSSEIPPFNTVCPVSISQPLTHLKDASIEGAPVSQTLISVLSDCPNLLSLTATTGSNPNITNCNEDPLRYVDVPNNSINIKGWTFNVPGTIEFYDWFAPNLMCLGICQAGLKELPRDMLSNYDGKLKIILLSDNELSSTEASKLVDSFHKPKSSFIVNLSGNPLLEPPMWNVDHRVIYQGNNIFFGNTNRRRKPDRVGMNFTNRMEAYPVFTGAWDPGHYGYTSDIHHWADGYEFPDGMIYVYIDDIEFINSNYQGLRGSVLEEPCVDDTVEIGALYDPYIVFP